METPEWSPALREGDEITFVHQAVQHRGYILAVDQLRRVKGSDRPGAVFVRVNVGRGAQTSIWLALDLVARVSSLPQRRRRAPAYDCQTDQVGETRRPRSPL